MSKQFHISKDHETKYESLQSFQSENKYRRKKDEELAELEKQIAEAEGKAENQEEQSEELEAKNEEKKSTGNDDSNWKKRYGDLRSHISKKEQQWQSEIEELKQKLEAQTNSPKYPTTEEEYLEWVERYPKVAAAMQMMILKNTEGTNEKIEKTKKELEQERTRVAFERAYNKLLSIHPDFEDLREEDQFQDWLAQQPIAYQNTIERPSLDDDGVRAAAATIKLYKQELGLDKPKKQKTTQDPKDAAKSVSKSNTTSPSTDAGENKFSESQVAKMSSKEFESLQDEIIKAQREGRFEYDLSGAAR